MLCEMCYRHVVLWMKMDPKKNTYILIGTSIHNFHKLSQKYLKVANIKILNHKSNKKNYKQEEQSHMQVDLRSKKR